MATLPRVQFSIVEPIKTHKVNVDGTLNLLGMCKKYGVKRFVFSSSSSIYGNQDKMPLNEEMEAKPISPYALHKLIGEHYCRLYYFLYGIETIGLRYFNVYGERQNSEGNYACLIPKFTKMFLEGKQPIINGDGKQTRDFTYVGDIVKSNLLAYKTNNKKAFGDCFNVGTGKNYSVNFITEKIREILGTNIKTKHGKPVIEPKHTLSDISKIKRILGWKPKIELERGLKRFIKWYKK